MPPTPPPAPSVTIRVNHAAGRRGRPRDRHRRTSTSPSTAPASSDADGDHLIHTWDFGDGSPPALGETVTHAYPRSGIFPVTLTVDDGTGLGNAVAVDCDPRRHRRPPDRGGRRQPRRLLRRRHPLRRQRLERPRRRPAALRLGLRRRHPLGHRQPEQDLRAARRLSRHPDGARRVGPAHRRAQRPHRRHGARGADRRRRPADHGLHQPDRAASTARAPPTPTARSTPSPGTSATARPAAASARPTSSSAPGSYTVVLTITGDARGACGALDTAETTVTVVEAPRIEIVGPDRVAAATPTSTSRRRWSATRDVARRQLRLGLRRRRHRHRPERRARLRRAGRADRDAARRCCPAPTRAAAPSRPAGSSRSTRRRRR